MSMTKKIKLLLVERDMTMTSLSEKLGIKAATLSEKLKRDNLSEKDLIQIADALNCDYDGIFTMRDTGKKV